MHSLPAADLCILYNAKLLLMTLNTYYMYTKLFSVKLDIYSHLLCFSCIFSSIAPLCPDCQDAETRVNQ